ncbi:MAG: gamma-glutamylcyclotransferase family protein [bacterium]
MPATTTPTAPPRPSARRSGATSTCASTHSRTSSARWGTDVRLFVYGTLQDPAVRANVLGARLVDVVRRGTVAGALYDLGEYPGLIEAGAHERVPGLVLDIADDAALQRLDRYEGVDDGIYRRQLTRVTLDSGGEVEAWVYVYARSVEARRRVAQWPE